MNNQRRKTLIQLGGYLLLCGAGFEPATASPARINNKDPLFSSSALPVRLLAAWQTESGAQVGVLEETNGMLSVAAALDVPTRPHGLAIEPAGTFLAVARRPGDWLVRWNAEGRAVTWAWIEPERAFNGHVLCDAVGQKIYTSETDLSNGAGLIGVRDASTLEKEDEWLTHGRDPHALVWDARSAPGKSLMVANGGLETRPETGRIKLNKDQMDSSLVRIDADGGELSGQWRLGDRRLSLRHLAWQERGPDSVLGIAMQAEHDDALERRNAPVLAVFDGEQLKLGAALTEEPRSLEGYGGDIAATERGFTVSCPRAQGVAQWNAQGEQPSFAPLPEACALSAITHAHGNSFSMLWIAGNPMGQELMQSETRNEEATKKSLRCDLRLDNHWVACLNK